MGVIVIACFKPKNGNSATLKKLMETHIPILKKEGLVTDRKSIVMESREGTILEVFEWKSDQAIEEAHKNTNVLKMWEEYAQVCNYVSMNSIPESAEMFPGFKPVDY